MTDSLSPADIAAVQGGGFGGFGNEGLWLFAILAMMGGGFGSWGNRGGDRNATVGDVQRSTDFAALERQNNETVAAVRQAAYDNQAAVKDGNYNILGELRDLQECCCNTLRGIDSVNYNGASNTASINANTTAQTQKILDAIAGNRMADMQNQINQLQLQAALCGIPRTTPYGYGIAPQFATVGCGCGNGNI